ncbi:40S ribosomal protein S4 [Rhizina undulata]
MPLIVFIRNRLKYALNSREVKAIVMQSLIKVDGKVRRDPTDPAGFMDVIYIEKTRENFRLICDTKGRFPIHRIQDIEAFSKLAKVKRFRLGKKKIPYLFNDAVKIDRETGKITKFIHFDTGCVGVITHRERLDGGFDIVHLKDAIDNTFATRLCNVFVLGQYTSWVSLPKGKGVKLTIAEERDRRCGLTTA